MRTIHIGPDLARELKAHRERQAEVKERMGDDYRDTDLVCTTENGSGSIPDHTAPPSGRSARSSTYRPFGSTTFGTPTRLYCWINAFP